MRRLLSRLTGELFRAATVVTVVALLVNVASGALVARRPYSGLKLLRLAALQRPFRPRRSQAHNGHRVRQPHPRVRRDPLDPAPGDRRPWRVRRGRERPRSGGWRSRSCVGTFAQGPLGGITVLTDLHPIAVMTHFLLAVVVLALAIVLMVVRRCGRLGGRLGVRDRAGGDACRRRATAARHLRARGLRRGRDDVRHPSGRRRRQAALEPSARRRLRPRAHRCRLRPRVPGALPVRPGPPRGHRPAASPRLSWLLWSAPSRCRS